MVIYFSTAQIFFKKKILLIASDTLIILTWNVIIQLRMACLDLHC